MRFVRENFLWLLGLVLLGGFIYLFNLHNPLYWDDTDWIVNNPLIHSFAWSNIKSWFTENTLAGIGLRSNYYRPFLFVTFAFNYLVGGTSPLGYHLVNNALHIANALMVFWLLFKLSGKRLVAFVTALFFLVHPLQTEAVTYIAGRGDPLNGFFMLLGLVWFVRAEQLPTQKRWRWLSLGALVLALLSRETAIIFPFLAATIYLAFISRERFWLAIKGALAKTCPYWLVVFIYGLLRLTVLNFDNTLNFYSQANVYSEHLYVRMFTFLSVLLTYWRLLLVPIGLHMDRSAPIYTTLFYLRVWTPLLVICAGLFWCWWLYRQAPVPEKGNQQLNSWRVVFFSLAWFFINLGPTSGITPVNAILYEHWLYLALVGPFFLLAWWLYRWYEKYPRPWLAGMLIGLVVVFASWFSVAAIQRNILWGNPLEFFKNILRYEPQSARINNNVGNLYYNQGDIDQAEQYYRNSVKFDDSFAQPHFNIGSILQSRGDLAGAKTEFEKAIVLNPYFPQAYHSLAGIYANQGDLVNAETVLQKLLTQQTGDVLVYYYLAQVQSARGNKTLALDTLKQGLALVINNPKLSQAMQDLSTQLTH